MIAIGHPRRGFRWTVALEECYVLPVRVPGVPFLLLVLTLLLAVPSATFAGEFPTIPFPACMPPDLPATDTSVCEGTRVGYSQAPQGYVGVTAAQVSMAVSTRTLDFRLDADRGGQQLVTFTFTVPAVLAEPGASGSTIRSGVQLRWPDRIVDGASSGNGIASLRCTRPSGFPNWIGQCDGVFTGSPGVFALLERQGTCERTTTSCTYRVTWGAYNGVSGGRTHQTTIYKIGVSFDVGITRQLSTGEFDSCGSDPFASNCITGQGASYVTLKSDPPPPLTPVGVARRLGARKFLFDATGSAPDVVEYRWLLTSPALDVMGIFFEHDFSQDDLPPFTQGGGAQLLIKDKWLRTNSKQVLYSFLAPAGVEGPLEILSFDIVDVDEDGLATLKAVVKNVGSGPLDTVFLLGEENQGLVNIHITPDGIELDQGESREFTVTFEFDDRDRITARIRAFGTNENGPVQSAEKTKRVDREPSTGPTPTTTSTTVSHASSAGADELQVTSTNGFAAGDYAHVNPGGGTAEIRHVERLASLVFSAPLSHPHAVGEVVTKVSAPSGDTTPPTITVMSPPPGGQVCQGAVLAADFSCTDAGVGVEECGGAVSDGQALDTSTVGARQLTIEAWDENGNTRTTTVDYAVTFCSTTLDAFRCYRAKPSAGQPKLTPITGVRMANDFDDILVDLKKELVLCAPAETGSDGFVDDETHLEGYAIKPQKDQPKSIAHAELSFVSQLGTLAVDIKKPDQLWLPTAEDPTAPPTLGANEVDRFACYKAKLAKTQPKLAKDLQITVADQFTSPPKRFVVKKVVRLCVPVGVDAGAPKHDEHLLCFQVAMTKGRCDVASPLNAGGGCKKETDCGGTKGETTLCVAQTKFTAKANRRVANDLDDGMLDAAKEDILCLPAAPVP